MLNRKKQQNWFTKKVPIVTVTQLCSLAIIPNANKVNVIRYILPLKTVSEKLCITQHNEL